MGCADLPLFLARQYTGARVALKDTPMHSRFTFRSRPAVIFLAALLAPPFIAANFAAAQQTPTLSIHPLEPITFATSDPVLRAPAQPQKPFTVAGERGVLLGQQDGTLEAWVLPVKLLSHLTLEANVEGYPVPIDVNQIAASIEVRPDRTILTYSHVAFTVRQIMFSPAAAAAGTGPVILYQFDCLHPTDFIFRFTPNLQWMWPERNEGVPGVEWVPSDPHAPTGAGFYILHADYPDLAGALTIPGARPGILAPYQEPPQVHPVELKLHIDPARDSKKLFPLLMAVGMNTASATNAALGATLAQLDAGVPALYQAHAESWKKTLANAVSIETPDKALDEAFQWSVISIEQLRTHVGPTATPSTASGQIFGAGGSPQTSNPGGETALVAGYFASADSTRPGFGWFFGRDALYTLYAVNGYGDFALTRSELEFLIRRQREDGKIMHEYSQTAAAVDWRAFPYMYAAADATPLFLLAVADYARATGDTAFLTAHRDAIERAWAFETDPAHDTDHDGIYDNSQGTGWVESWPASTTSGGMPHQEIYLALLDQQASSAMGYIERALQDSTKAESAEHRAETVAKTINAEYYDASKGCYAFSHNVDGTQDRTSTVYPALAWWDPAGNKPILEHTEACLQQWIASPINTDWGTRDVSNEEKIYDGMSYHQGSVWPLFTGWAALAEYRGNQPLAGYQLLKENANLTRAQDLGAHTELLSGDFFVPMGRSTSHQLWSSAMVITPTLRGLFGISIDAATKTITVNPHLPWTWSGADIKHLALAGIEGDLLFRRDEGYLRVLLDTGHDRSWKLRSDAAGQSVNTKGIEPELDIPYPPVQLAVSPRESPLPGSPTSQFRVLSETYGDHKVTVEVEGLADSYGGIEVNWWTRKSHEPKLTIDSPISNDLKNPVARNVSIADYAANSPSIGTSLVFHFPPGEGFKTITVTLTW